jgi:hypothetical protein
LPSFAEATSTDATTSTLGGLGSWADPQCDQPGITDSTATRYASQTLDLPRGTPAKPVSTEHRGKVILPYDLVGCLHAQQIHPICRLFLWAVLGSNQ